jgi:hypothetical protein
LIVRLAFFVLGGIETAHPKVNNTIFTQHRPANRGNTNV